MENFAVIQASPADQPEIRVVLISGSMTIQHGGEIREALVEALGSADTLLLDLKQVTEIDLIGLQVICATHRSSIARGKRFSVIKSGNRAIETAMRNAGFSRHTGCIQDTEHSCVWTGGQQQ